VTFERGFADTERAANVAAKSVVTLAGVLKELKKAAAAGDIAAMRKSTERAAAVLLSLCQDVENARIAWPFSIDSEELYMRDSYMGEILEAARADNVSLQRLDDGYLVYPSILRVIPSDRCVMIDRKRIHGVRPSRLVKTLKAIQSAKPKIAPQQFLELLHRAYRLTAGKEYGKTLALSMIYEAITLAPGSNSTYGQMEFVRDLFLLDRSGVTRTKSGAKISLPASTGTKGAKGTFSFVSPDGESVTYYGIQFLEGHE
jgi:hypothetical protein